MKAILIDAPQCQIRNIEVDISAINVAFATIKTVVPIQVTAVTINKDMVLLYDRNGVLKHPAEFFYLEGLSGPVFGKGILLGHRDGLLKEPIKLAVSDIEPLVAFNKTKAGEKQ